MATQFDYYVLIVIGIFLSIGGGCGVLFLLNAPSIFALAIGIGLIAVGVIEDRHVNRKSKSDEQNHEE